MSTINRRRFMGTTAAGAQDRHALPDTEHDARDVGVDDRLVPVERMLVDRAGEVRFHVFGPVRRDEVDAAVAEAAST